MNFRAFVGLVIFTAAALSLGTSFERHSVAGCGGDEETSIKTWMTLSDSDLDSAAREVRRNPFESILSEPFEGLRETGSLVRRHQRLAAGILVVVWLFQLWCLGVIVLSRSIDRE